MKRIAGFLLCAGLVPAAWAQDAEPPARQAETYFGVLADYLAVPDDDHLPEWDSGLGLDLRYGVRSTSPWSYEFRGFYSVISAEPSGVDDGVRSGLGADLLYSLPVFQGLTPYVLGGGGLVYSDLLPGHDQMGVMLNAGAGLVTQDLGSVAGRPLRLRGELRYSWEDYRESYLDLHALLGVEIPWSTEMPPPAPQPVAVVEAVEPEAPPAPVETAPAGPADSDGDGITDDQDRCPGSAAGKPVDTEGCTILKVLTLQGVNFEVNSDRLKPDSAAALDEAAATLNTEFPEARIEVAGHTDSSGDAAYNLDLSQRRATTVLNYLVAAGVDAQRLTAVGYGETEPVADNTLPEGRAGNRRVELRVKGS
jgi:OOP family OmpA-OmpF porin